MALLLLLCAISALFFILAGIGQRWVSFFGSAKDASNYFFTAAFFDLAQALILLFAYKLLIGFIFYLFLALIWVFLGMLRRIEWNKQNPKPPSE
jgi:hypothetical protein